MPSSAHWRVTAVTNQKLKNSNQGTLYQLQTNCTFHRLHRENHAIHGILKGDSVSVAVRSAAAGAGNAAVEATGPVTVTGSVTVPVTVNRFCGSNWLCAQLLRSSPPDQPINPATQ